MNRETYKGDGGGPARRPRTPAAVNLHPVTAGTKHCRRNGASARHDWPHLRTAKFESRKAAARSAWWAHDGLGPDPPCHSEPRDLQKRRRRASTPSADPCSSQSPPRNSRNQALQALASPHRCAGGASLSHSPLSFYLFPPFSSPSVVCPFGGLAVWAAPSCFLPAYAVWFSPPAVAFRDGGAPGLVHACTEALHFTWSARALCPACGACVRPGVSRQPEHLQ